MSTNLIIKPSDAPLMVDVENRTFDCYITKANVDRDGEYISPDAFRQDFHFYEELPILIIGHQHKTSRDTLPVGKGLWFEFTDDGIKARYYITKNPIGDELLNLLDESIIRGVSAGFIPKEFIPNPKDHELPLHLRGKGLKKLYKRVELVEVSILSIPSNREALVIRAEKGNKIADIILKGFDKGFDNEDLTPILKEWLLEEKEQDSGIISKNLEIDLEVKNWKNFQVSESKKAWSGFVGKIFGWNESEHRRDEDGKFTFTDGSGKPSEPKSSSYVSLSFPSGGKGHEEVGQKLDALTAKVDQIQQTVDKIDSKDGWLAWVGKWGMRIGTLTAAYYGTKYAIRRFLNSPEAKAKAKEWLMDAVMGKGYDESNRLFVMMDLTKRALTKAESVGATDTIEYSKIKSSYDKMLAKIKEAVSDAQATKGLSYLLVTKEVDFKEEEHPRNVKGEFRKKSEGAGVKKAKASHVDEDHKTLDKTKIEKALDHPDKPGAGATRRRRLKLTPEETFAAVMAEFKRGTLQSGDGTTVLDAKQAKAIALSEKKKRAEIVQRQAKRESTNYRRALVNTALSTALIATFFIAYPHLRRRQFDKAWKEIMRRSKEATGFDLEEAFKKTGRSLDDGLRDARDGLDDDLKTIKDTLRRLGIDEHGKKFEVTPFKVNVDRLPKVSVPIFHQANVMRDTAETVIDQIKKGTYDDEPVPKYARLIFDSLTNFKADLRSQFGKNIGAEKSYEDTDKILYEFYSHVTDNWMKHGKSSWWHESTKREGFFQKEFLNIITKEWTSEDEAKHPRAPEGSDKGGQFVSKDEAGGKTTTKPEALKPVKNSSSIIKKATAPKTLTTDEKSSIRQWASENKGKVGLMVGLSVVSTPLVVVTARYGKGLTKVLYSDITKKATSWDKLSDIQKAEFRSQAKPGDILLSGGRPHVGYTDFFSDAYKAYSKGDKGAKTRFYESLTKGVNGGNYSHARMVVGNYNLEWHQKILDFYVNGGGYKKAVAQGLLFKLDPPMVNAKGVLRGVGVTRERLKEALKKTKAHRASIADEAIVTKYEALYNGKGIRQHLNKIILAVPDHKRGQIWLVANDKPLFGEDAISAILRPKLHETARNKVVDGILEASFGGKATGAIFKIGEEKLPPLHSVIDETLNKLGDPGAAYASRIFLKDNKFLCGSTIAHWYKKFGGVDLGSDIKYIFPQDLVNHPEFAGTILHAGAKKWEKLPEGKERVKVFGRDKKIETKEWTDEDERKHPRANNGEFTDKEGTDNHQKSDATIGSSPLSKTLAAGAVIVGTIGSYFLLKNSNIVKRSGNIQEAKEIAEDLLGTVSDTLGSKKRTKAVQSILQMSVESEIKDVSKLTARQKEIYDYVTNPKLLQKDLMENFGHLDFPGPTKIIITKKINHAATSFDEMSKSMTSFNWLSGTLNINMEEMEKAAKALRISSKQLLIHEYAHSFNLVVDSKNYTFLKKYQDMYRKKITSLTGKKVEAMEFDLLGSPTGNKLKGIIKSAEIVEVDQKELTVSGLDAMGLQLTKQNKKAITRLENRNIPIGKLKIEYENGYVDEAATPQIAQIYAPAIFRGIDVDSLLKIEGLKDWREIYGLMNTAEMMSVMAEKGIKLT